MERICWQRNRYKMEDYKIKASAELIVPQKLICLKIYSEKRTFSSRQSTKKMIHRFCWKPGNYNEECLTTAYELDSPNIAISISFFVFAYLPKSVSASYK